MVWADSQFATVFFFLFFFLFFFGVLPKPQVTLCVRSGPIRAQNASVPRKEVLFGGLNDVPQNFGGKTPKN